MNKKRLIFALAFVGVLVILSFCLMNLSRKNQYDYANNSRIFEDINDLAFLDEFVVDGKISDNNPHTVESLSINL